MEDFVAIAKAVFALIAAIMVVALMFTSRFKKAHKEGDPIAVLIIAAFATWMGVSWSISSDRVAREKTDRAILLQLMHAADEDLKGRVYDLACYSQKRSSYPMTPSQALGRDNRVVDLVLSDGSFLRFMPAQGVRELARTINTIDALLSTAMSGDRAMRDTSVYCAGIAFYEAHEMICTEREYLKGNITEEELIGQIRKGQSAVALGFYGLYWSLLEQGVREADKPEMFEDTHWEKPFHRAMPWWRGY